MHKKHDNNKYKPYERVVYVMQGGGSLGAYQVGAYRALHEYGYEPNWIAGISIGAINAAIIAGNPPEQRLEKLNQFWDRIATHSPFDEFIERSDITSLHSLYNRSSALRALMMGQSDFFSPNILNPWFSSPSTPDKLSFYDTAPLKKTLLELIDFDYLNSKRVWLSLGAVHIKTGRLIYFNNVKFKMGPEHIMASAALPPGFPAVEVNGELFWDGGVFLNTPITAVFDAGPVMNTLCFMIDCFNPVANYLPDTLDRIQEREKDIRYSGHNQRVIRMYSERQKMRASIAYLGSKLPDEMKKDPKIQQILNTMSCPSLQQIVHLVYRSSTCEHSQKDYNFARATMLRRMDKGYQECLAMLKHSKWENVDPSKYVGALVYSNIPELQAYYEKYEQPTTAL